MEHVSLHGVVIALLQFIFVLGLLWTQGVWRQRRLVAGKPDDLTVTGLLIVALLLEFAVLRWQPLRRDADAFGYSLGLFDAFTLSGLVFLGVLHHLHRPRPGAKTP